MSGGDLAEQALLLLRHLLHVVAFADRSSRRRRCDRRRRRSRPPRASRRAPACAPGPIEVTTADNLAVLPAQRGRGMRHRDLVAEVERAGDPLFLVDAQHVAEIGRAVSEDREIFAHALLAAGRGPALPTAWSRSAGQRAGASAGIRPPACTMARARERMALLSWDGSCMRFRSRDLLVDAFAAALSGSATSARLPR